MNFYATSALALVLFYILLIVIVSFFQRNLLYHPSVDNYIKDDLVVEPTEIEKVKIITKDKIDLIGWYYNRDIEKFKTILFFHGNAGSLKNRTYKLNHFKDLNVNFLITLHLSSFSLAYFQKPHGTIFCNKVHGYPIQINQFH